MPRPSNSVLLLGRLLGVGSLWVAASSQPCDTELAAALTFLLAG